MNLIGDKMLGQKEANKKVRATTEPLRAVVFLGQMENDGIRTNLRAALTDKLSAKGWELDIIDLAEARLTNCIGCFECWVKTPGQCRFGDFGRELAGKVIHSDLFLIVSRIRFGSYSSDVQRAWERMLPLLSPLFEKVDGETHHVHRYDRYPSIAALGVLDGADGKSEEIFRKRVKRNSINIFSPSCSVTIVGSQETSGQVEKAVGNLIAGIEVAA